MAPIIIHNERNLNKIKSGSCLVHAYLMLDIFNTFKSIIFVTSADVNECQSPDACGANSVCNNTVGSYRCDCENGFVADCGLQNSVCVGEN